MEAEAVWGLFVDSWGRADIPEGVRRDVGGAAKRIFPTRYRRFHERLHERDHPEARRKRLARIADWRARNPERVRLYMQSPATKAAIRRFHAANPDYERQRARRRYWAARPDRTPPAFPREGTAA